MPRALQGAARSARDAGKPGPEVAAEALAKECMGEAGRDHLRSFLASTPFATSLVERLDEDGYCVLPGVFSAKEMDVELDRAWDFIQKVSPSVKRGDWNTWWGRQGGPDPWPHAQRDMMQLHQAGWLFSDLREQMANRVFEPLYGTRELHVSKDGFTFQRPTYADLDRTPNDHFDQGMQWMGLQCIQGSVAITDQKENDGCFSVWPGSHHYREEILSHPKHRKAAASDFIIIKEDDKELLRSHGINSVRVPVKRGDVILWRSDVCHCGAPPLGQCDTYRVVSYICCLPAALTPEDIFAQKRRAYQRLETGCHYPNREEWFELAARHKRLAWKPYFERPPQLTPRQQELYGLRRYEPTAASTEGELPAVEVTDKPEPPAAPEKPEPPAAPNGDAPPPAGAPKRRWGSKK